MKLRAIQPFPLDWYARSRYCRWFYESIADGFVYLELVIVLNDAFTLHGNVNGQNNMLWYCRITIQSMKFLYMILNLVSDVH